MRISSCDLTLRELHQFDQQQLLACACEFLDVAPVGISREQLQNLSLPQLREFVLAARRVCQARGY